jgi:putative nucleotidyltransferase with HDIG domain
MNAAAESRDTGFVAIPFEGLEREEPLGFPLYLQTADSHWVLYRDAAASLPASYLARLRQIGVHRLFIRERDRQDYFECVEAALETILANREIGVSVRGEVLHGVARNMAADLFGGPLHPAAVQRATHIIRCTATFVVAEAAGFDSLRHLLEATDEVDAHSLTVALLSIGLGRLVLGARPEALTQAGLAGLLHDVGRIGDPDDESAAHSRRGHELLIESGVPTEVAEVALYHHERADGSGFPDGLIGDRIPLLARIVGLCDTFDNVYSSYRRRIGVYDALHILAEVYHGCFDPDLTFRFLDLFED